MKPRLVLTPIVIMILSPLAGLGQSNAAGTVIEFHNGTTLRFASMDEAEELLGSADDWVRAFGPLDRQFRMQSEEPVDNSAFLEFAKSHARDWGSEEIATTTAVMERVANQLKELRLQLDLPSEILLVRTTGKEEGGAGYTRSAAIVFPESQVAASGERLESFVLHELFHVMTRHNPAIRKPLYKLVGFETCSTIDYPAQLVPRKITNPDGFHFDATVEVSIGERSARVTPLTLSTSDTYTGGTMFEYLTIQFLEVEVTDGKARVKYADDLPVLHEMGAVTGYTEQIGGNTGYIIHPEEIMADNFAIAVRQEKDVPNPEIPAGVIDILSGN